ncbi:hypothetical protein [Umezawaea sp. NPDC059074]|uniref:hypothetical protein n=1 Tax=Umezawaea sp. NPDC059074 TaxID=3346716 RepID=UPI0036962B44
MNEVITEQQALHLYPELRTLVAARHAGWRFRELREDDEPVGIAGSLTRKQYSDTIFVYDRNHVIAARVLDDSYGGGCVWSAEGTDLEEIVSDLLGLPEPGMPNAPHLVRRSTLLWTP